MADPIDALIERLREARKGSRELDCAIFCSTAESPFENYYPNCILASLGGFSARVEISEIPKFTTSLDAATELCERLLVGWHWSIRKKSTDPDFFEGMVTQAAWSYAADRFKASHDCGPIALTLAILMAVKEKSHVR